MLVYNLDPGNFGNCSLVLSFTSSLLPSSAPLRHRYPAPPAAVGRPRPPPACRAAHASRRSFSTALWLRAGPLPPAPRAQLPARGRHLAAAVEGPLQHLGLPSCARISTPGDLTMHSTRPLARSLPQTRRTPPPPRVNSDELTPAVDPPLCSSSALADHSISCASSYRSSPTPSSRSTPTGTTPPP